ncbi:MAG TPA: cation-translocating P-type ATPase [Candidatus Onthenecus intestinigallinarum]|uniref:P-type Ca(2+) transporter n=1 Tax=Candidatus Onthenecus intestinigallinarum TaxID=2840875 RepID=A0A9D1CQH0_9FIRM|nr:cation-translocating P-type ATPase [Candidatus Onthenecus intestinigallinarum]
MRYETQEPRTVLAALQSDEAGLSQAEAARRLTEHGPNKLAEQKKPSLVARFFAQFKDPMTFILLAAAAVSGFTAAYAGESFADVIIILAVVIINALLGVIQESKAEQAIEALQRMSAARSRVRREGAVVELPSSELVPGDVVLLEAGDAVPADARLLHSASLKVEEAALTGESVPVEKHAEALACEEGKAIPLGDRKNMVYMGSTAVYGRAEAVVTSTGMRTEMGKIATALQDAKEERTPLQLRLAQLSRILSAAVLGICAFIFLLGLWRAWPIEHVASLIDTFMVAVSLAVAAIPEGLATVVTIVLSIGVTNMSRRNAIIRRLTAVETLGCAQVVCSDKTGTLTQNRMTVTTHAGADEGATARAMALCSDARLNADGAAQGEPTEAALVQWAAARGLKKPDLEAKLPRVAEAPFDSGRKMMSTVHRAADGFIQYTKGAPDALLERCTHAMRDGERVEMTDALRAQILSDNKEMADRALRVLAAAERRYDALPGDTSPEALEQGLTFLGLCGMIDPVRPEAKEAVARCREAGIRPVMITGDHRDTAVAIARELGILRSPDEAITGADLDEIDDETLQRDIERYSVYARVQPEHKVRIVQAWKQRGRVTAMTGDGVNDAPSIKAADIGVGMGITGTDVTKNVADMVLTDDNFATIVSAVEEGRRIYDNIRKSIQFLLSSNLSEVVGIFVATLLGFTLLKPVHLLWINLITDCFPALALGLERAEPDVMRRPPRDPKESILAGGLGAGVVYQGALVAAITLFAYLLGHYMESGQWAFVNSPDGMTMAFLTMSMAEIFHSFNMRSQRGSVLQLHSHNVMLWGAMALSLLLTTAVIYVPFLSAAFGFEHISAAEYFTALGLAFLVIPVVEIVKFVQRRLAARRG